MKRLFIAILKEGGEKKWNHTNTVYYVLDSDIRNYEIGRLDLEESDL